MKSVKERVIAQVQAEWHDCSQEKAEQVISSMTQWELLEYISAATDEMFKEQWDQTRNALIASSR